MAFRTANCSCGPIFSQPINSPCNYLHKKLVHVVRQCWKGKVLLYSSTIISSLFFFFFLGGGGITLVVFCFCLWYYMYIGNTCFTNWTLIQLECTLIQLVCSKIELMRTTIEFNRELSICKQYAISQLRIVRSGLRLVTYLDVGNFCDKSTETTLHELCVQVFLRFSDSSKSSQSVSLIYELAWLLELVNTRKTC